MLTQNQETRNTRLNTNNSTDIALIEPTTDLAVEFLAMAYEFQRAGDDRFLRGAENLVEYLRLVRQNSHPATMSTTTVPCNEYWLVQSGWLILGTSSLRRALNPQLAHEGGHIGYCIRPSQRQKGYGRLILQFTLEQARQLGLHRVLITCNTENSAAARTIKDNGGILENDVCSTESGKLVSRYWVDLRIHARPLTA